VEVEGVQEKDLEGEIDREDGINNKVEIGRVKEGFIKNDCVNL
jgi:hypothetical protein